MLALCGEWVRFLLFPKVKNSHIVFSAIPFIFRPYPEM